MTNKSKVSSDDTTIRVQPLASEEWIRNIPRRVKAEPFFTGNFQLEIHPEKLEIPRNGSLLVKFVNPTDVWQVVMVERNSYADYWPLGGHFLKLMFVIDPKSSKEVQFEHADNVTGKKHDRRLEITHGSIKDKKEAKERKKKIANAKPKKKSYDVHGPVDGIDEVIEIRGRYEFDQYLHESKVGAYHLKVAIKPEPPVTKEELAKDPTPADKKRSEPEDPFSKMLEEDWHISDDKVRQKRCCCFC